jgi:hypothetical protein
MVTGRRAFDGKSQISVASAILEKEPEPIRVVRPMTPPALDYAIRTCMAKDPEKRWQNCRDLALALRWIGESESSSMVDGSRPGGGAARARWMQVAWIATAAVAITFGSLYLRRAPAEAQVTRTHVKAMADTSFLLSDGAGFALSPNGRMLVYLGSTPTGKSGLWVRPIESLTPRPLEGTDGAKYPFWSPDSRYVGFFAGGKLKTIDVAGGPPLTICDTSEGRGGTWNQQGEILFTPSVNTAIYRVSISGGTPAPVTTLDPTKNEISHRWPWFLPDGRHFLFLAGSVFTPTENPTNVILVGSLDSKETKPLLRTHAGALYASGHILYLRKKTLMAQLFDLERLEVSGVATPIADPVREAVLFSKGLRERDARLCGGRERRGPAARLVRQEREACGRLGRCGGVREPPHLSGRTAIGLLPRLRWLRRLDLRHGPRREDTADLRLCVGAGEHLPGVVSRREPHRLHVVRRRQVLRVSEARGRGEHGGSAPRWGGPLQVLV